MLFNIYMRVLGEVIHPSEARHHQYLDSGSTLIWMVSLVHSHSYPAYLLVGLLQHALCEATFEKYWKATVGAEWNCG